MIWKTRFFFLVKKSERAISWIISMFTFWLFIPFWNLSWTILYQGCYLAPLFSPFFWSPRGDSNPAPSGSQQKSLTARPTGTHVNAGWKHGPYYPKIKIIIFFNDVKTTESDLNPFEYFNTCHRYHEIISIAFLSRGFLRLSLPRFFCSFPQKKTPRLSPVKKNKSIFSTIQDFLRN
jgi:hypothetical protein